MKSFFPRPHPALVSPSWLQVEGKTASNSQPQEAQTVQMLPEKMVEMGDGKLA